jgi:serine O-acetyltransferase
VHGSKIAGEIPTFRSISASWRVTNRYPGALDGPFRRAAPAALLSAARWLPLRAMAARRGGAIDAIRQRHPRFAAAVLADARVTARYRGERAEFRSRADAVVQVLRLAWQSDAFCALVCYRAKARMQARGVPVLPRLAHRLAMALAQVCIGDPVVVHPGVYVAHGQVVVDGLVEVHSGVVLFPWVTIGLRAGELRGPTIEHDVHVGTGAKVIGPIVVGARARIGANAVVVRDVPAGCVAVGVPARVVPHDGGSAADA